LSSIEEETCAMLAQTSIEYEINKMTKWHYQLFCKVNNFLFFIFMHLNIHLWLCFCAKLTVEEERESSTWSVSERVFSSLNLSGVGIEIKMENGPINVDELLVYEQIMKGATIPVELEAKTSRGSRSPLIGG